MRSANSTLPELSVSNETVVEFDVILESLCEQLGVQFRKYSPSYSGTLCAKTLRWKEHSVTGAL